MKKGLLSFFLIVGFSLLLLVCSSCTPKSSSSSTSCAPTNTDGAETIFIDGATFQMGSLPTDVGAKADEQPQHQINLGCYNIYKKEVTNAMYNKCVAIGVCVPVQPRDNTPTAHVNDPAFANYPVVGVDYNMATEYCTWAGARLPTEAEWEYAARGTKLFTYPWGNNDPACNLADSKPGDTEKVGNLTAGSSPLKLMDMAGNAWEWVFDWYDATYYQKSPSDGPTGPLNGFWKVVRGGGYNSIPALLRSANRHAGDPYKPYYNVGFRCASGAFTVSEGYVQPNPNLHRIPIDGPVDDDDPNNPGNPSLNTGILPIGCPDGNGNLHIFLQVSSPDTPQLGSFYFDGVVFGCNWDAGNHWYECVGPAPQNNDPTYSINYCFHVGNGDQCMQNVQVPKPQNCDGSQTPIVQTLQVTCPNEGKIKAIFHAEPAVTWDLAQIDGDVNMDCSYLNPLDYQCTAPDVLTNGKYAFHLHGKGVNDNTDYTWYSYASPNPNCPKGPDNFKALLDIYCNPNNGNLPVADIEFMSGLQGNPIFQLGGVDIPLQVNGSEAIGQVDPSLEGQTVPYALGIDQTYYIYDSVAVPQCPQKTINFQGSLTPYCDNGNPKVEMDYVTNLPGFPILEVGGFTVPLTEVSPEISTGPLNPILEGTTQSYIMGIEPFILGFGNIEVPTCTQNGQFFGALCYNGNPFLDLFYWPETGTLQGIEVSGTIYDMTKCQVYLPGHYICPAANEWEGTNVNVDLLIDGVWTTKSVWVPKCAQSAICSCRFLGADCLTTTAFGFSIQTCANNPTALVAQSVTATDGINTYQCQLTNQVGVAYCGGTIPNSSGPLTVCYIQQGSQDQHCCTIDNFASTIPSCANFNPNPGEPPCSSYDAKTCPTPRCVPVYTSSGPGSCKNP